MQNKLHKNSSNMYSNKLKRLYFRTFSKNFCMSTKSLHFIVLSNIGEYAATNMTRTKPLLLIMIQSYIEWFATSEGGMIIRRQCGTSYRFYPFYVAWRCMFQMYLCNRRTTSNDASTSCQNAHHDVRIGPNLNRRMATDDRLRKHT